MLTANKSDRLDKIPRDLMLLIPQPLRKIENNYFFLVLVGENINHKWRIGDPQPPSPNSAKLRPAELGFLENHFNGVRSCAFISQSILMVCVHLSEHFSRLSEYFNRVRSSLRVFQSCAFIYQSILIMVAFFDKNPQFFRNLKNPNIFPKKSRKFWELENPKKVENIF